MRSSKGQWTQGLAKVEGVRGALRAGREGPAPPVFWSVDHEMQGKGPRDSSIFFLSENHQGKKKAGGWVWAAISGPLPRWMMSNAAHPGSGKREEFRISEVLNASAGILAFFGRALRRSVGTLAPGIFARRNQVVVGEACKCARRISGIGGGGTQRSSTKRRVHAPPQSTWVRRHLLKPQFGRGLQPETASEEARPARGNNGGGQAQRRKIRPGWQASFSGPASALGARD